MPIYFKDNYICLLVHTLHCKQIAKARNKQLLTMFDTSIKIIKANTGHCECEAETIRENIKKQKARRANTRNALSDKDKHIFVTAVRESGLSSTPLSAAQAPVLVLS